MSPLKLIQEARCFARGVSDRLDRLTRGHDELCARQDAMRLQLDLLQEAAGRLETRQTKALPFASLGEAEYRVFSQGGEDGILQALVRLVPISRKLFVEFGVQDYSESNTRFLLLNDQWSGLVLDCDPGNIQIIQGSRTYLQHPLQARCALVTRENINSLLAEHGAEGEIGLLSIDVDGNDYWIWEAVEQVRAAIVLIEYNHRFGPERSVTIPYDAAFRRETSHPSMIYYGASLAALHRLGRRKGYDLVGCTRSGVNAVFVRADLRPEVLPARDTAEAFVAGSAAEWRDAEGRQQRVPIEQERELVFSLPLVEIAC